MHPSFALPPGVYEMTDHASLAEALIGAVLEAGAVEMHYYRTGFGVETKSDDSPVTIADREAEIILIGALAVAAPDIPIVAEEAVSEGKVPKVADAFFLVDPLDGTREFVNKRDEFTVNVALVRQGRPVFGIVYAPALDKLYVTLGEDRAAMARVAPRARADHPGGTRLADLALQPIHTRAPDLASITAMASRSHSTPETEAFLARFNIGARTNAGSSLKFCVIAEGAADLYPRLAPTMEWDTAAAHAVLLASGGCVTTIDGQPLTYGKWSDRFLNPGFVAWGTPTPFSATS